MKNSKIKLGLVTLLMSTALLVGCNSGPNITPDEKPHEHTLTSFEAKDPTYYKEGNIKYYYCPTCKKFYSDAEGTKEIKPTDVVIKKKTILEETAEAQKEEVEVVLQNASVENGEKKFVSLKKEEVDATGLYVSRDKKEDYTTISFNFSNTVNDITFFSFDYRYLDNCNDREYDMLGHSFLTKKLDGEAEEHTYIPHSNDKLNKDCAWHTFTYKEENNLEGNIDSLKLNIYHFNGELVINNVYIIHKVAGTVGNPSTVDHYEDLEGGCYYYDYDSDEYISVDKEDINIQKQPGQDPTCEEAGFKDYYYCEYTRQYYSDKDGKNVINDLNAWKSEGGEGYLAPAHKMDHFDEVKPTCTAPGVKEYYQCSVCGKYFEDSKGEKLIGSTEAELAEWKASDGKIEALGHNFDENGNCTRCGITIKNALGLEDATRADLINQISLSKIDIAATEYTPIPDQSKGHIFGTYDMYGNGGIDLVYNFKITGQSGSYNNVYIGNKVDESGLQIRFLTDRTDNYVQGYFYSDGTHGGNLIKGDGTPFYSSTDTSSIFYVKQATHIGEERKIEIKLEPVTSPVVANHDMYKLSIFVNDLKFKKSAEGTDTIEDLYVGFPKGYFRDESGEIKHNKVRFSYHSVNSSEVFIKEAVTSNPNILIMLKPDGTPYGKSDLSSPITLPELHKDGHKFAGWFDETGAKMSGTVSVSNLSKKTIIKPLFVQSHENMYVPSDFTWDTKGKELHPTGEAAKPNVNIPAKATRLDVYFVIKPTFTTSDNYFYFSLPYDMIDAKTRVEVRASLNANNSWYWNSDSSTIGGAGASTSFKPTGLTWQSGINYLFHIYVEEQDSTDTPYRVGFDVTNLVDLSTYQTFKDFKFNDTTITYKVSDNGRSKLGFRTDSGLGSADFSVTDAW